MNDTPRPCSVCKHIYRTQIEAMLAAGQSLVKIETEMRALEQPVKRETIAKHLRVCQGGNPLSRGPEIDQKVEEAAKAIASDVGYKDGDFATLVQRKAIALLDAGLMRISARDGLGAQALIDRREEKAEDRRFMVNMARLLAGAGSAAPAALIDSGETIDGIAVEVEDESLFAPASLRDPDDAER